MDTMPVPLLAAISDEDYLITHDSLIGSDRQPVKCGFMFTSPEFFTRFAETELEVKANEHQAFKLKSLDYRTLHMHLLRARNEAQLDFVLIDYAYEKNHKFNHLYSLLDVKDTIARLDDWGKKTKWGEGTENAPGSEKPPYPRIERLTGRF